MQSTDTSAPQGRISVEDLKEHVQETGDLSALESLRVELMFSLPLGMKSRLESTAKEQNTTVSLLVRQIVAAAINYPLPKTAAKGTSTKYASEAEKKAVQASKDKAKRDLVKSLQAMYRAGSISEDDDEEEEEEEDTK